MEFKTDIFSVFDKGWALLTAGDKDTFNTMTVSWGGMGTLWGKPVVTVYVRQSRYTLEFLQNNDYFTLSMFPEEYKKDLGILGSKSGRDGDKVALTGLTPKALERGVTFAQASRTFVCRKLYEQKMDLDAMPEEVLKACYPDKDCHSIFIGEVEEII